MPCCVWDFEETADHTPMFRGEFPQHPGFLLLSLCTPQQACDGQEVGDGQEAGNRHSLDSLSRLIKGIFHATGGHAQKIKAL